ncbi:MAG: hypothetical protein AB1611_00825 [bacterium]
MKIDQMRIIRGLILTLSTLSLVFILFVRQGNTQIVPYYPPAYAYTGVFAAIVPPFVAVPPLYGYPAYSYPVTRTAATTLATALLLPTLLAPTTTTTAAPVIGVSTAITLATLGGTSLSATTLATLAATPVPTTVTTTPTIGTTTALLLSGGGVSTSTLLLLGI